MTKKPLAHFSDVYRFTCIQHLRSKPFQSTLLLVGFIVFAGVIALTLFMAHVQSPSALKNVYVDNTSSFAGDLEQIHENPVFENTLLTFDAAAQDSADATVQIRNEAGGYYVKVILPDTANVPIAAGRKLAKAFEEILARRSGIDLRKIIHTAVPILPAVILLVCMLMYTQIIARSLLEEKTSKLMEMILNEISPYALVAGKVTAISVMTLMEILAWALCAFAGIWTGEGLRLVFEPQGPALLEVIGQLFSEYGSVTSVNVIRILGAILAFLIGFSVCCTFASLLNSYASKPEDHASTVAMAVIIMAIAALIAIVPQIYHSWTDGQFVLFPHYIPICAPFSLASGILLGQVGVGTALLSMLLMLVLLAILLFSTGKVYRNRVFYRGSSVFQRIRKSRADVNQKKTP